MKKMRMIIFLILATLTACQQNQVTVSDEKAIEELNKQWNENILSGNRLANAELFTDDGVRIENGKIYSGKDEIRSLFGKQTIQRKYIHQENKIQRIWSSKDFITAEIVQIQIFIQKETGDTITKRSAAIGIFVRQPDGSLKLAYNLKSELTD